jgi:hypothetical protein
MIELHATGMQAGVVGVRTADLHLREHYLTCGKGNRSAHSDRRRSPHRIERQEAQRRGPRCSKAVRRRGSF